MNSPGAMVVAPLAALPTPPMAGVLVFAVTDIFRVVFPEAVSFWAFTVIVCGPALRGTQVAAQRPPPMGTSGKGGSPAENVTTIEPVFTGRPQSSKTWTSRGTGAATLIWNSSPSGANNAASCVVVHM